MAIAGVTSAILAWTARSCADAPITCADARISVEGPIDSRWLAPIVSACEQLKSVQGLDPTARLRIAATGDDLLLEVVLEDGRQTRRKIRHPAELWGTILAVVTLPPSAPAAPVVTGRPAPQVDDPGPVQPARTEPPQFPFSVELGGALMGRLASSPGYGSVGPELHAGLHLGPWMFGLSVRWGLFENLLNSSAAPAGFDMVSAGAGFLVERRLLTNRSLSLDAGPTVMVMSENQSFDAEDREFHRDAVDVRVGAISRLHLGRAARHPYVSLDGEVSPARLRKPLSLDPLLPNLPSWTLGLALGLSWEAR